MHTIRSTDRHPLPVQFTEVKEVIWKGAVSHPAAAAEWGWSWGVEGRTGQEGRRVFRWGRSLGTSFNSTLLWKLQLPLSRLAPRLHPSTSALFATQTTSLASHPGRIQVSLRAGFIFWGTTHLREACLSMCAPVRLICEISNMHKKVP